VTSPLLEVHDLVKTFPASGRGTLRAIDGVSFTLDPGETLGLVGESGCGKSTIARLLLGLIRPTSGRMLFGGRDIAGLRGRQLRALRRDIQMVFQDPFSSLDPRMPCCVNRCGCTGCPTLASRRASRSCWTWSA
jgi:ABC-type oligopeptide transport system ATPase subunit